MDPCKIDASHGNFIIVHETLTCQDGIITFLLEVILLDCIL